MFNKPDTIDEYIAGFPENIRLLLTEIRTTIIKIAPDAEESIRYNMPAFKIIYMAAYKNHIGMYPIYGMKELEDELITYRGKDTKDAIHFKYDKSLPLQLIEEIVKIKLLI